GLDQGGRNILKRGSELIALGAECIEANALSLVLGAQIGSEALGFFQLGSFIAHAFALIASGLVKEAIRSLRRLFYERRHSPLVYGWVPGTRPTRDEKARFSGARCRNFRGRSARYPSRASWAHSCRMARTCLICFATQPSTSIRY